MEISLSVDGGQAEEKEKEKDEEKEKESVDLKIHFKTQATFLQLLCGLVHRHDMNFLRVARIPQL